MGGKHGYDGGKKIDGRKRHIVVDTLGLLVAVVVTAASVDDGMGAQKIMGKLHPGAFPRLRAIFGDSKCHNHEYNEWLAGHSGGKWHMVLSSPPPGTTTFKPLPIRALQRRRVDRCRGQAHHGQHVQQALVVLGADLGPVPLDAQRGRQRRHEHRHTLHFGDLATQKTRETTPQGQGCTHPKPTLRPPLAPSGPRPRTGCTTPRRLPGFPASLTPFAPPPTARPPGATGSSSTPVPPPSRFAPVTLHTGR
jgi:Transposase DDE domain